MPPAQYARFTRYAAFAAAHAALVLVTLVTGADALGLAVLVAALPLVFAWGHFQADLLLNPLLEERARTRWRVLLWCVPWSMTAYWFRHVRPRRV